MDVSSPSRRTDAALRSAENNSNEVKMYGFKPQVDSRVLAPDVITVIQEPSNYLAGAAPAPGARPLCLNPQALAPSALIGPSTHGRLRSSSLPSTARRKAGLTGTREVQGSPKAGGKGSSNGKGEDENGRLIMGKERIQRDLAEAVGGGGGSLVQGSYERDMKRFAAFENKLDAVFGPSEILQRIDDEADRLERRELARIRALHQTKTLQQQKALASAIGKPINDRALAGVHAVVDGRGQLSASASQASMGSLAIDPSASSGPGPVPSTLTGLSIPGEEREPKYNLRKTMEPALWGNASERLQRMFNNPPVVAGSTKFHALRSGFETHFAMDDFSFSKPAPGAKRDPTVDKEFPLGKRTYDHANRHNTEPLS